MGETPGGLCLPIKPCFNILKLVIVINPIELHGLDRYETLDRWIFPQIHKPHGTTTQFFQHPVASEHAGSGAHVWRRSGWHLRIGLIGCLFFMFFILALGQWLNFVALRMARWIKGCPE